MRLHSASNHRPGRAGFTIVELLVALALTMFIMAILSEAFVKGLEVFGNYKALSDLENRLRTAANLIRRDLRAPHFEGNKKLSECTVSGQPMPRLDGLRNGIYASTSAQDVQAVRALLRQLAPYQFATPEIGFFSIEEWPNRAARAALPETLFYEGTDAAGRPSYRDIFDVLHFTSRLEGNEPDKFFYCKVRPDIAGNPSPLESIGLLGGATRYDSAANRLYTTQMAELLYFLENDDTQFIPGAIVGSNMIGPGPVRTFNLYRQVRGLVPDRFSNGATALGDTAYTGAPAEFYKDNDISVYNPGTGNFFYNSMADVQHRARRRLATNPLSGRLPKQISGTTLAEGSDILLTNVLSFDIKVWDPFAYKIPLNPTNAADPTRGPLTGRGAFVDIGDVQSSVPPKMSASDIGPYGPNPYPTAAGVDTGGVYDVLPPAFGGRMNNFAGVPEYFDTGTRRFEGPIGSGTLDPSLSPSTHPFPFNTIQITIRVFEPRSRLTRSITIIQDL